MFKMAIPASQLETWSHEGSVSQSSQTYATVKNALEASTAPYADRNFKPFLQGSYGNDTNIWAESDVDVVIRYDGAYYYDLDALSQKERDAYHQRYPFSPTYAYRDFRGHVQTALTTAFGNSVKAGTKALKIEASGSRRSADVVVAFQHRRYHTFNPPWDVNNFTEGITFLTSSGSQIDNFPSQHSDNLTIKHQATSNRFKPTVRIFKNMRTRLVADKKLAGDIAPSYYIEGLLYNVPNDNFVPDEGERVYNILKWLDDTKDKTKFVCANRMYYLFWDNSQVCWPRANGEAFMAAIVELWNNWS